MYRLLQFLVFLCWGLLSQFSYGATPVAPYQQITDWQGRPEGQDTWHSLVLNGHGSSDHSVLGKLFWLRTRVALDSTERSAEPSALLITGLHTANEVYWDGQLVYTNGRVGHTAGQEKAGIWKQHIVLPTHLTQAGAHTITIRASDHQFSQKSWQPKLVLSSSKALTRKEYAFTLGTVFIIGVLLTAAVFSLLLYTGSNRKVAYLFLCLYCVAHSVKLSFKPRYFFVDDVELTEHYFYANITTAAVLLGGFFLLLFLLHEFSVPHTRRLTGLFAAFAVAAYFLFSEGYYILIVTCLAFAMALYAVHRRQEGSWLAVVGLGGLAVCTSLGYREILNLGYIMGILFFIVCMSLSIGRQLARQYRLRQEAILRSVRLENQLLRKNIQPHFLFNTLTSLQELIDQNPPQASQLIDALAEEFRMISNIAEEKLIPIEDELKICHTHLKIMGFRREAKFALETHGLSGKEQVPPATFHTLIENGLTHGYGNKGQGRFVLSKEPLDRGVRYKLFNDSDLTATSAVYREGTGSRYVKARLEESFPGCWQMQSAPVADGWAVVIDIYDHKQA
ncbi:histidine kinase [Hymenobacter terrenus]|uniref:histidine kinase n=1 Tax=Hymenobacter terrenus TaxID=1629124 RepID=UPI0009E43E86|nr:sensor histidine kinase [Hymenobacter terrenus]